MRYCNQIETLREVLSVAISFQRLSQSFRTPRQNTTASELHSPMPKRASITCIPPKQVLCPPGHKPTISANEKNHVLARNEGGC